MFPQVGSILPDNEPIRQPAFPQPHNHQILSYLLDILSVRRIIQWTHPKTSKYYRKKPLLIIGSQVRNHKKNVSEKQTLPTKAVSLIAVPIVSDTIVMFIPTKIGHSISPMSRNEGAASTFRNHRPTATPCPARISFRVS